MKLTPYINFGGNAREALEFYKNALNGEILYIGTYGGSPLPHDEDYKDKVMHATLAFGNNQIMISDVFKGMQVSTGGNIQLSIGMDDAEKLTETFNKMADGGKVTMPLQETFWSPKFGMLNDKFGVTWMFSCEAKQETQKNETLDITV